MSNLMYSWRQRQSSYRTKPRYFGKLFGECKNKKKTIIPGASHLFEEQGKLNEVSENPVYGLINILTNKIYHNKAIKKINS